MFHTNLREPGLGDFFSFLVLSTIEVRYLTALSEKVCIKVLISEWGISRSLSFINGCYMDNGTDSSHDDEGRESRPAETAEVWEKYNRSGIVAVTIYKSCDNMKQRTGISSELIL
jgi:hypothetical protein